MTYVDPHVPLNRPVRPRTPGAREPALQPTRALELVLPG